MGEGTALHGGAGHRGCHQSRPQPLPEVCSGVHAEGPRLPARSALRKLLEGHLEAQHGCTAFSTWLASPNDTAQRDRLWLLAADCFLL